MADNTFVNIGGHKVSAGIKYSTTEVKTGDVWIDGKPIYCKVFTGNTANESPGSTTQPLNISNLDKIIRGSIELYDSAGGTVNVYYSASNNYVMYYTSDTNLYVTHAYANRNNRPYVVILWYTKTTD